ncbi:MAG TPA: hypothetical protein PK079_03255 [Leptospiraceae bacterium]|nr:hypothetical protein [Leptospiraceae bacterium]HMX34253.1 hypothetical protein [Leptospiraceae bacterium]HMY29751.1 hypothetical protein [Leptospiraceae bacterium]HMZ62850.1 hypothetical protein [Leptospiraceae bacterium]HNA06901.1 hypothetical protein [Leptospiraceae bacterium]
MKQSKLVVFLSLFFHLIHCQHARLRVAPPLPKSCQMENHKQCEKDKHEFLEKIKTSEKTTKEIHQTYFLGGLLPREYKIQESKYCPDSGIYEILQYYTFEDALFEQLTAFIYSPRTVRITCY